MPEDPQASPPLETAPSPESPDTAPSPRFADLGLGTPLLEALEEVGYEAPSPIQARTIPLLVEGRDVLGQAQTGTGKTASFALPILQRIDLSRREPQALVLTPTRELALQVAEAFQKYAKHLDGFRELPVYGGQALPIQMRALDRGVHVVVGTPGRIMDHLRRGSLSLDAVQTCVLDEADEMLRMGFFEDVTWILDRTPDGRQVALFSATLPPAVQEIARKYLSDPERVTVEVEAHEASQIRQRAWIGPARRKLEALTRILEVEPFDAMLIFVRTRGQTVELVDKLSARGIAAAPLSGDVPQHLRERTVEKLKRAELDVVVATDVAARGLDVDRITHVLNFDAPIDPGSYVHRIGRTGRAGREGIAITLLTPRERRMLYALERATGARIETMDLPTVHEINQSREERLRKRVLAALGDQESIESFRGLFEKWTSEDAEPSIAPLDLAAALGALLHEGEPFRMSEERRREEREPRERRDREAQRERPERGPRSKEGALPRTPASGNELFRIEVGYRDRLKPAHVVAIISREGMLDGRLIGNIDIHDGHTFVELPEGMPEDTFEKLRTVRIQGKPMGIERYEGETSSERVRPRGHFKPRRGGGPRRQHQGGFRGRGRRD
ncbi:MAG TPA: DEAD/DEAH box helicase [Planctomycetes bacterium]|nr:DEAD/DEAH box helicase [Planctomycetota bacterium]